MKQNLTDEKGGFMFFKDLAEGKIYDSNGDKYMKKDGLLMEAYGNKWKISSCSMDLASRIWFREVIVK